MKYLYLIVIGLNIFSCSTKKITTSNVYIEEIHNHRAAYKADFLKDERSPLQKEDLEKLRFFEPNASYKCECTFEIKPDSKPFEMATYSGETRAYQKYGTASCKINGVSTPINIYRNLTLINIPGYKDYLFIPFKDYTNGESTYGGGRYIDIVVSDIREGKVTLDFNKCYNPWCAYSDGYSCPIPPLENHLSLEIFAGEKLWTGEKKH